jgi:hypothetical protein
MIDPIQGKYIGENSKLVGLLRKGTKLYTMLSHEFMERKRPRSTFRRRLRYVTRFSMQAPEATNTLAIFGRLYNKSKVDNLMASSKLAGTGGKLVGLAKLGLERSNSYRSRWQ